MAKKNKGNNVPKNVMNNTAKGIPTSTEATKLQAKLDRELGIAAEACDTPENAFNTFKGYKKHEVMRILGLSQAGAYNRLKKMGIVADAEGWINAKELRDMVKTYAQEASKRELAKEEKERKKREKAQAVLAAEAVYTEKKKIKNAQVVLTDEDEVGIY